MTAVAAPEAPGRLGETPDPIRLGAYLDDLRAWCASRRTDLDMLDEAVRASSDPAAHTSDVVLALTLWQAVRGRLDELDAVWDGGRVDVVARETMTRLVWGRLSSGDGAALVSLVEAVRLCDAIATSLAARVGSDGHDEGVVARLRAVRAALARGEDLSTPSSAGSSPTPPTSLTTLRSRLDRVAADVARGADVTGPLTELERDVARAERDLIVAASRRRDLTAGRTEARARVDALEAREPSLHALVARTRAEIASPPRLAVPDVSRLGDVPDDRAALDEFTARLERVERAVEAVEDAYTAPLRERARLRFRAERLGEQAERNGRAGSATFRAAADETATAVDASPCDLVLAAHLVEQLDVVARPLPSAPSTPPAATPGPADPSPLVGQEGSER